MSFTEFITFIGEGIYILFSWILCRWNDSRNLDSNMHACISKDDVERPRTITTLQY